MKKFGLIETDYQFLAKVNSFKNLWADELYALIVDILFIYYKWVVLTLNKPFSHIRQSLTLNKMRRKNPKKNKRCTTAPCLNSRLPNKLIKFLSFMTSIGPEFWKWISLLDCWEKKITQAPSVISRLKIFLKLRIRIRIRWFKRTSSKICISRFSNIDLNLHLHYLTTDGKLTRLKTINFKGN